jgi:hypothetical protein
MTQITRKVVLFLVCLTLILGVKPASADIAPPDHPSGSNPHPGSETTKVQMVAETVTITVQPTLLTGEATKWGEVREWAKVRAVFTMRNRGTESEKMMVRFPVMSLTGWGDGFGNFPELKDLVIKVDNQRVTTQKMTTPNPANPQYPGVTWAAFEVTFPPDVDVVIDVTYTQRAVGYPPIAGFFYVLETGAGWYGPIERADLIVQLPYPANPDNVILARSTSGGVIDGNTIRWHFEDLEPTSQDNFDIHIIEPQIWQEVLYGLRKVDEDPNDGTAWGTLARAYKKVILDHKGYLREDEDGKRLFHLCVEAYEKATALSPVEPRWHAGYAELLWHSLYPFPKAWDPVLLQILKEIEVVLKIDPQNHQALILLEEMVYVVPDAVEMLDSGYDLKALTATVSPSQTLTLIPSDTPTPAQTSKPTERPTGTITPAPTRTSEPTIAPVSTETVEIQPIVVQATSSPAPFLERVQESTTRSAAISIVLLGLILGGGILIGIMVLTVILFGSRRKK